MTRTVETVTGLFRERFPGIAFLETQEASEERYHGHHTILYSVAGPGGGRVVKFLSFQHLDERQVYAQKDICLKEYQIVRAMQNCPYVIRLYDQGVLTEGSELLGFYFVTERFNATLDQLLDYKRRFTEHEVFEFLVQLSRALNYVHHEHSQPVVHSDVKPANIGIRFLPGSEYEYVLMDFDVSSRLEVTGPSFNSLSNKAKLEGFTEAYAAPEQILARTNPNQSISSRVDIYSVGVVAAQMLTGLPPYRNEGEFFYKVPLNGVRARWKTLILNMCSMNPRSRPRIIENALIEMGLSTLASHAQRREGNTQVTEDANPLQDEGFVPVVGRKDPDPIPVIAVLIVFVVFLLLYVVAMWK